MAENLADYIARMSDPAIQKPRAKTVHHEDKLHAQMAKHLSAVIGPPGITSTQGVFWQSLEARARRSLREGASNKRRGVAAGFPELVIIDNGAWSVAEIKNGKAPLTESQKERHPQLLKAGVSVEILRSFDDLIAWLAKRKIPTRQHK